MRKKGKSVKKVEKAPGKSAFRTYLPILPILPILLSLTQMQFFLNIIIFPIFSTHFSMLSNIRPY